YVDNGISQRDWQIAKNFAHANGVPLTNEALIHTDEVFEHYLPKNSEFASESQNAEIAEFRAHTPLRMANEENLIRNAFGAVDFETLARETRSLTSQSAWLAFLTRLVS